MIEFTDEDSRQQERSLKCHFCNWTSRLFSRYWFLVLWKSLCEIDTWGVGSWYHRAVVVNLSHWKKQEVLISGKVLDNMMSSNRLNDCNKNLTCKMYTFSCMNKVFVIHQVVLLEAVLKYFISYKVNDYVVSSKI